MINSAPSLRKLAVIIPFRLSLVKPDGLIRLAANLNRLRKLGVSNVSVSDSSSRWLSWVAGAITWWFGYTTSIDPASMYSPGRVKNNGAQPYHQHATVTHILFLDVDVLLGEALIQTLCVQVRNGVKFDWIPVIFTSKRRGLAAMLRNSFFERSDHFEAEDVYQLGYVTGIQIFHVDFFYEVGGYDSEFEGYGCEDIEMLHRATGRLGLRPKFPPESDYYLDKRTVNLDEYEGFRKYYYDTKRDTNADGMAVHFWHARKPRSSYLRSRPANDIRLLDLMRTFDLMR